jgi:DNA-binding beta-propeller fold protein YncE
MLPGLEIIDLKNKTFDYFNPAGPGQLKKPVNCDLDEQDRLYVADVERKQIVVFDRNGDYLFVIDDGLEGKPSDVLVYQNKVWVTDLEAHQIRVYDPERKELLFSFPDRNKNQPFYLFSATNLTAGKGKIYVTDTGDARIKMFTEKGEFLGSIGSFGKRPGQFVRPKGIAVDRQERLYIADAAFENVQIFNAESKILMHFGGNYNGPGRMWLPAGICIDYEHLQYFQKFVYHEYELQYLILVANQYGPDRISIYGFVKPK